MILKDNRPSGIYGRAAAKWNNTLRQGQYTTEPNSSSIHVRRSDGRIVGVIADGVLRKQAKHEHMLRSPAAWAWDTDILETAESNGVEFTEIKCDGLIYRASLADFRRYGLSINRGHGQQTALALGYWNTRRHDQPAPAVQLTLWGER